MPSKQVGAQVPRRGQGGLTLVETMVTLAVAAILLTAAVPPMQDFIIRNRMSTEVNTLVASLYLARSEAVKRLQNVVVCPTTDGVSCSSASDWSPCKDTSDCTNGWMVFSDSNNNGQVDGTDNVLQQEAKLPGRFMATGSNSNRVIFTPTGAITSAGAGSGFGNTTITFVDCKGVANTRTLTLSREGRVYTTQLTTSGGCSDSD